MMTLKSRGLTYMPQESNSNLTVSENNSHSDLPKSNSSNISNSNAVSFQHRVNFSSANSPAGLKGTKDNKSSSNDSNGIDPRQVYLQLFKQSSNEIEQTFMIPELPEIHRTQTILDYLSCFMIHRIGVVYIGSGQTLDEKSILSNTCGSPRYNNFLKGLGTFIKLKDLDTNKFYPGGLETDGSAGDFTIIWFDGITQFLFHVVTMMKGSNCNSKKKHIGNDHTIIVYNESGEEYNFSMIKSEVNCICIEVEPLKNQMNLVKVKTTSELANHYPGHTDPKAMSDLNLPFLVRKMAFHAELAAKVYRSQKDGAIFGGKWCERLRKINRIRSMCVDGQKSGKQGSISSISNQNQKNEEAKTSNIDFTENI